jgi:transcriptional regulator with XRE-family HTH domain
MSKPDDPWRDWAARYRAEIKRRHKNLAKVAEALDVAESTVRSWTNGTREPNLSDFFAICRAGEVDPAMVLFGRPVMTDAAFKAAHEIAASIPEGA